MAALALVWTANVSWFSGFVNEEMLFETAIFDLLLYMPDLGGIFGALTAGVLCDRYGRRPAIVIGATITLIATGIQAASVNLAMFLAFAFFAGFGYVGCYR